MEIVIQPTQEAATSIAARLIARLLKEKPNAVLGLATGSTPLLLYRELAQMKLDWHRVTTFNLDEYVGLTPQHPASYHYFMRENLFRHVNIPEKNIHIPDGMTPNVPAFCERYEKKIRDAGGIDLQLLGIGSDGHIGFNEPTSSLASRTRMKTLTERTRSDNAKHFGGEAQALHHVITMAASGRLWNRAIALVAGVWQKEGARHRRRRGRPHHGDEPGLRAAVSSQNHDFFG